MIRNTKKQVNYCNLYIFLQNTTRFSHVQAQIVCTKVAKNIRPSASAAVVTSGFGKQSVNSGVAPLFWGAMWITYSSSSPAHGRITISSEPVFSEIPPSAKSP
mmetsp:Transcript_16385/g.35749  ORF Transcript_16385/g.35749 Transcript_16385/m.35749 type:complete len:103 (-) Transcript_16385:9540-9848(-)